MKKHKNEKGITLIALTITVIVMLILAGVTIAAISGNNGILQNAARVKEETEQAEEAEKEKMEYTQDLIDKYNIINLADNITANNYGDYVKCNIDLNNNGNMTDDWRIFYNNGNNVFLIAADYLDSEKLPTDVNMITNKSFSKYSIYWNDNNVNDVDATSIKDDVASKFMINWISNYPDSKNNPNMKAISSLLDTESWKDLVKEIKGAEAIGSPTLEMFIASWNEKGYEKLYCDNSNSNGYYVGKTEKPTVFTVNLSNFNDDLYFLENKDNVAAYWIASPVYTQNDHIACMFSSHAIYYQYYFREHIGVRPVMCLPENMIANKINNTWNLIY